MALFDYLSNPGDLTPNFGGMTAGDSWATQNPLAQKLGLGASGKTTKFLDNMDAARKRSQTAGGGLGGLVGALGGDSAMPALQRSKDAGGGLGGMMSALGGGGGLMGAIGKL